MNLCVESCGDARRPAGWVCASVTDAETGDTNPELSCPVVFQGSIQAWQLTGDSATLPGEGAGRVSRPDALVGGQDSQPQKIVADSRPSRRPVDTQQDKMHTPQDQ